MSAADVSALVIALRAGVAMTLIVGIVLAYLTRIGARRAHRFVWAGVGAAAIVSLAFLGVLNALNAEIKGTTEKIYEGATLLLASAFLTWMILWMLERSRYLKSELQRGVQDALASGGAAWGRFLLALFTVAREGVETALLLFAAPGEGKLFGTIVGFAIAIGIGVLIYVYGRRLDLATFFRVTGSLLIVFAAGLVTHGVHEFVEAGLGGGPTLFDLRSALPDAEGIGAVMRTLLGYSADPTLLEGVAWVGYFVLAGLLARSRVLARRIVPKTEVRPAQ